MKLLKANANKCLVWTLGAIILATVALTTVLVPQAQASFAGRGNVYVWGSNLWGQLGTGEIPDPGELLWDSYLNTPTLLPALADEDRWRSVSAGSGNTFALTADDRLFAWGSGSHGRLGIGRDAIDQIFSSPIEIPAPSGAASWDSIHTAGDATFAFDSEGRLFFTGFTGHGQAGNGSFVGNEAPPFSNTISYWTQVPLPAEVLPVRDFAARSNHTLLLGNNGVLYSWGSNVRGQLGINTYSTGTNAGANTLQQVHLDNVSLPVTWERVFAGGQNSAALTTDGRMYIWGTNLYGTLGLGLPLSVTGDNRANDRFIPTLLPAPSGTEWSYISFHGMQAHALTTDGRLFSWGSNTNGRTGLGVNLGYYSSPQEVMVPSRNWAQVEANFMVSAALTAEGALYTWGPNHRGQLGQGDNNERHVPTRVGDGRWHSMSTGNVHIVGIQIPPLSLYKHLQKPEGTPDPEASFTFNIARHSFDRDETLINRVPLIDSITLTPSTITNPNAPDPAPAGITTRMDSFGLFSLFDDIEFTERGRFTYRVSEVLGSSGINTPATNFNYPVNYSRAVYEVNVYVVPDVAEFSRFTIAGITVYRVTNSTGGAVTPPVKVDDFIFTNTYRRTITDALEVSKRITGHGTFDPTFTFTITLTPTAFCPSPTNFTGRRVNAAGTLVNPQPVFTRNATTGITTVTVTLGHNERFVLDGNVAVGTGFEVVEAPNPYHIASVIVTTDGVVTERYNTVVNTELSTLPRLIGMGTNSAAFTNYRPFVEPMGLLIGNGSPYVLFIAAALMTGAILVLKSRRRIEAVPIMGDFQYSTQRTKTINNTGEGEV